MNYPIIGRNRIGGTTITNLYFVTEKGGIPVKTRRMSFEDGVIELLQLLQKGEIKGVVFDVIGQRLNVSYRA